MVVLIVTYKCKPEKRDEFLKRIQAAGIDVACKGDKGCIQYDYYLSAVDSDVVLLVEKWTSAEDLALHSKQDHLFKLGALKSDYVNDTIIEKYNA